MQRQFILSIFAITAMTLTYLTPAYSQEMRVYTTLSDVRSDGSQSVRSHSLTLFHGGKVYDYLEEAGEVVIYEPVHHRFVLLGKNYHATEVPFTEINQFLESETARAQNMIRKISAEGDQQDQLLGDRLQWMLAPTFEKTFDEKTQSFEMISDAQTYRVKTAKASSAEYARLYLDYADWVARLNCTIYSRRLPEFRLQLNELLRKEDLLPVQVDLTSTFSNSNRKETQRAEHQFSFEFQSTDRRHITHWERQLKSNQIKWVPFTEYNQQRTLTKAR